MVSLYFENSFNRKTMNNTVEYQTATPESIWAILRETAQLQKENQEEIKKMQEESKIRIKENEKARYELQKSLSNLTDTYNSIVKERKEWKIENDKTIKELQKSVGSITNNYGSFAEEYFFNSFEKGQQNFFGKRFNEISRNLKLVWKNLKDEYDIVLYNDDAVAIIEVKFKAHENDIDTILKKAETFKILSPNYKDFKIYLGLASMAFYPALENKCIESGIAIIKQIGDKVVINDAHLKVF